MKKMMTPASTPENLTRLKTRLNPVSSPHPIAIWCITPNGQMIGKKLFSHVSDSSLFLSARLDQEGGDEHFHTFESLSLEIKKQFHLFSGHIFIFSTGIAVRMIAPLLKSKTTDPAVVVVDEKARHAVSLISGHLGGANELTLKIAGILGAGPVITTATDSSRVPAIDLIAKEKKLFIETVHNIKHINMSFLIEKPVRLYDPYGFIKSCLPDRFYTEIDTIENQRGPDGGFKTIFCSYEVKKVSRETLILRPPLLSVGIGCNRGTDEKKIFDFLITVLKKEELALGSISSIGTSEVKKNETGLLELGKRMGIDIDFYCSDDLNTVTKIKNPSEIVKKHIGAVSVCEAAAILSADNGELIVTKNKNRDVTIAVAIKQ